MPRTLLATLALTVALLLGATTVSKAHRQDPPERGAEDVVKRTFTVKPGQTLRLHSDLGAVRLRGDASGNAVTVTVTRQVTGGDAELLKRLRLDFRQDDEGVEIVGAYDRSGSWFKNRNVRVVYDVRVPHRFNASVKTAGGSITIAELDGDAKAVTSGGSLTFGDITGAVHGTTSGGQITAEQVRGAAELTTSGGGISVLSMGADVRCTTSGGSISARGVRGDLEAHTSGGGIQVEGVLGAVDATTSGGSIRAAFGRGLGAPVRLETSGGSVAVALPASARANLDAGASGGSVRSDLPVVGVVEKRAIRGAIGGGGPALVLRTSGGSVGIERL